MTADLSAHFQQFLDRISLGEPQIGRINSASDTVSDFLIRRYSLTRRDVFLQGSYANGTAIEPVEGGEYDVDLVGVCVPTGMRANDALDDLESTFRSDGRFRDRIVRKKPCVRLEYAEDNVGRFHVDVVPLRSKGWSTPPLQAPRRDEGWRDTAPAEYTVWCRERGDLYARTVKTMKRWRDEQQSVRTAIKSIVLQVLIADHMPHLDGDAQRLSATLRSMHAYLARLDEAPVVLNPVLLEENLASRWSRASFRSFVSELAEAAEYADQAASATDVVEAADAWREILGDDFPVTTPTQLGYRVSDYSHAETPEQRGWLRQLDPRYGVSISATVQRGKRGQNRRVYPSGGPLVFAGHKLHFRAHLVAPGSVDVWWQVANTGGHARCEDSLRGEIFRGRDLHRRPTADPAENWESTAYTGSHLVRVLLVRAGVVVAESAWFQVNIYAPGWRFSP